MIATIFHEFHFIVIVHQNYDLLSRVTLYGYIDPWFGFAAIFDNFLNVIDFVCLETREDLFNFEDFLGSVSEL